MIPYNYEETTRLFGGSAGRIKIIISLCVLWQGILQERGQEDRVECVCCLQL